MIPALVYASPILIIHIWPVTRDYEKNWHQISSNKAFYLDRQTGFSLLFIRFVFFCLSLLGWTVCEPGIVRDGTVTGAHLICCSVVHSVTHTHTRHHIKTWTHTPEDTVSGSCHFCSPPCVVLSVLEILRWAIKAATEPLMALRPVS